MSAREQVAELELVTDPQPVKAPAIAASAAPPALQSRSPIDVVAELLARGVTVESLEKILEIQRKHEAEQARRAYFAAMAAFKAEPIDKIKKKKSVGYNLKTGGRIDYKHETLDQVVAAVRLPMAKHGLSHRWTAEQQADNVIRVACVITHEAGHSGDPVTLFGMPDESGQKNALQQVRSTITFLQRATLLLATGLAAEGEDDDGRQGARNGSPPRGSEDPEPSAPRSKGGDGKATAKQVKLLKTKLERAGASEPELLTFFGVESIEALPFGAVNDALGWIAKHGG
jgi:hypothetical protein